MAVRNITFDYDTTGSVPTLKNGTLNPYFVDYVLNQIDPSDFEFENLTCLEGVVQFLNSTWSLAFLIGAVYVGTVFCLRHIMRNKKPIELKGLLVFWNVIVGLFSFFGFIRTAPELIKFVGKPNGFYESICLPNFSLRFTYWGVLFGASKVPELIDTVFVVLRKKPLEVVQWYHHLVTMIGCWTCLPYFEPTARYMVVINFGVHGIMYPYFALKAAGVNVPRFLAKLITTFQFSQMIICMVANLASTFIYLSGNAFCHRHTFSVCYSLLVNVSFIVIFGNLFVKLVVRSKDGSKIKKTE